MFSLIPFLGILGILGLYSIYLLHTGIAALMRPPEEQGDRSIRSPCIVCLFVSCYLVVFGIVGALFGLGMVGAMGRDVILRQRLQMPDRPAGRDRLRGGDDGVGVDAVVPVELGERAGLAEMLDAERARAMAGDRAEPGQRRRVAVEHGDDAAMRRHVGEQPLDMRARMHQAALARALRRGPAGIEPVGRGDREQADVAAVLRHQADGLDRLRRDRAGIGDDDLAFGPGLRSQ